MRHDRTMRLNHGVPPVRSGCTLAGERGRAERRGRIGIPVNDILDRGVTKPLVRDGSEAEAKRGNRPMDAAVLVRFQPMPVYHETASSFGTDSCRRIAPNPRFDSSSGEETGHSTSSRVRESAHVVTRCAENLLCFPCSRALCALRILCVQSPSLLTYRSRHAFPPVSSWCLFLPGAARSVLAECFLILGAHLRIDQMDVDLRRREVGVAQHALDDRRGHAPLDELRREAVPE